LAKGHRVPAASSNNPAKNQTTHESFENDAPQAIILPTDVFYKKDILRALSTAENLPLRPNKIPGADEPRLNYVASVPCRLYQPIKKP